ncbi:MAG: TolC family protein [Nitrospira sp.]|nr:TolC family protein [Nitrospira sp.]
MNDQRRPGFAKIRCCILQTTVLSVFLVAIASSVLVVDAPVRAANFTETADSWIEQILKGLFKQDQYPELTPKRGPFPPSTNFMQLSLDEAMALFLKQNLDLIIAHYGIDAAKGRQITARLFPNPTLAVNTLSSYTQGCHMSTCGAVGPSVSQLFEVAGKRGYRIRAAELEALSVEARFEDAVRQLGFTLKDNYFRLQRQRGHLTIDQRALNILVKLLQPDKKKQFTSELERTRLGLLTVNTEAEVLRDLQRVEDASGDLRVMLRLSPDVELDLETPLIYRALELNLAELMQYASENRPDIRALRLVRDKRKTELQLARVIPYPNVTAQLGYAVQGPHGPDNQQQWAFGLSVPLPVFNRNQGGIVEAEVATRAAEAEVEKALVQIQNEVGVAYRNILHAKRLVDATSGAIDRATTVFQSAQEGYAKNDIGILDLENARRSYGDTEISHLEALFGYYENLLRLERSTGRNLML